MKKSLYDYCLNVAYPGVIDGHHENTDDPGKPKIIIIGDMHMIPNMQRNIARFIFELVSSEPDIHVITCETDVGYIITEGFLKQGVPPAEQVEEGISRRILKGHEAASILLQGRVDIFGIEDPGLYDSAKKSMDSLNHLTPDFSRFRSLAINHLGSDLNSRYTIYYNTAEREPVKIMSAILRMMSIDATEEDYTYILFDKKINTFDEFCNYFREVFREKGYTGDLRQETNLERLFNSAVTFYNTVAKRDVYYADKLIELGEKVRPSALIFVVGDLHAKKLYHLLKPRCSELVYWHTRPGWGGDLGSLLEKQAEDVRV